MMVIMALATTFITGQALDLVNYIFKIKDSIVLEEISNKSKYKVLISFSTPEKGKTLLKIANSFVKKQSGNSVVTAMHLSLSSEMHSFDIKDYKREKYFCLLFLKRKIWIKK